jgi:hypothetical protein
MKCLEPLFSVPPDAVHPNPLRSRPKLSSTTLVQHRSIWGGWRLTAKHRKVWTTIQFPFTPMEMRPISWWGRRSPRNFCGRNIRELEASILTAGAAPTRIIIPCRSRRGAGWHTVCSCVRKHKSWLMVEIIEGHTASYRDAIRQNFSSACRNHLQTVCDPGGPAPGAP